MICSNFCLFVLHITVLHHASYHYTLDTMPRAQIPPRPRRGFFHQPMESQHQKEINNYVPGKEVPTSLSHRNQQISMLWGQTRWFTVSENITEIYSNSWFGEKTSAGKGIYEIPFPPSRLSQSEFRQISGMIKQRL